MHKNATLILLRKTIIFSLLFLLVGGLGIRAWAQADTEVLHIGGLSGDVLYHVGGDQQQEMINIQNVILSKSGLSIDYTEYNTIQEGIEALQNGEIDTLYPMTSYQRDLEPLGLTASNPVYNISWDIIFVGEYSDAKLNRIAVPGGRLAPYYCREVFPDSQLVLCSSRLDSLDAVIEGRADCAIFNGFQTENIVQNGSKYSVLTYTVLPADSSAVFLLRADDTEHLSVVNECIAKTTEAEKTDYMVRTRAVAIEESARIALVSRYRNLIISAAAVIAIIVITMIAVTHQVIMPLREFNRCIKSSEKLPLKGNSNLRRLAATYNQFYEENEETQRLLHQEAERDGLTGLYNRRSFDRFIHGFENTRDPYMLIIADVDFFKGINDEFGHSVGDQTLIRVSSILESTFRKDDLICRIGGDEFAVIAVNPGPDFRSVLKQKIEHINDELSHPKDGSPTAALSVGAVLSETGLSGDEICARADAALYQVKARGRKGLQIYERD